MSKNELTRLFIIFVIYLKRQFLNIREHNKIYIYFYLMYMEYLYYIYLTHVFYLSSKNKINYNKNTGL